jgi:branched-chain amino acid transport system ATP-binding protein
MSTATTPILSLSHISKRFDGLQVLEGVSLDVYSGETLGLIGPNGAGKTTLFNIVSGILEASSGTVTFDGQPINHLSPAARARRGMVRTFQKSLVFPELTVLGNLSMAILARRKEGYRWRGGKAVQQQADLEAQRLLQNTTLAAHSNKPASTLSYGEQRILDILLALAQKPRLLLLDEPSAGLSAQESEALFQLLHQQHAQTAIILIAHDIDIIFRESERIAVLNLGRLLIIDRPDIVRADEGARMAYLGELAHTP